MAAELWEVVEEPRPPAVVAAMSVCLTVVAHSHP